MIAIFAISPDIARRHYAKFRGFKRCSLMHDHANIRPVSLFSRPKQAGQAKAATAIYDTGLQARENAQELFKLVTSQATVFHALHGVMLAACEVAESAEPTNDGNSCSVLVDAALLRRMSDLAQQAVLLAQAETINITRVTP